jgi:hypothetical protein
MKRTVVACVVTALVVGGGTAAAGRLITSGQIQDGTIRSVDIRDGTIRHGDLRRFTITRDRLERRLRRALSERAERGQAGATGPPGPAGPRGEQGAPGLTQSAGNWGVMNRGIIGSPTALLRSGPATPAAGSTPASSPPFGQGSLNLSVAGGPGFGTPERVAFGNEVDFAGVSFQSVSAVGFHVFTTGENISAGGTSQNMPSITFEVNPNLASSPSTFASLVFLPLNSDANRWSPYIDATTTGRWGGTGAAFAGTPCDINGTQCSFAELQAFLDDGGEPARILTAAVTKGRDFSFSGAVDGLRIGNTVYDFEEHGVVERAPG